MDVCRESTRCWFGGNGSDIYKESKEVVKFNVFRGCRIVAITSAFQADDAGSIPATRSSTKAVRDRHEV